MADNLFINGIMDEKEYTSVINKKEKIRDDLERKKKKINQKNDKNINNYVIIYSGGILWKIKKCKEISI